MCLNYKNPGSYLPPVNECDYVGDVKDAIIILVGVVQLVKGRMASAENMFNEVKVSNRFLFYILSFVLLPSGSPDGEAAVYDEIVSGDV